MWLTVEFEVDVLFLVAHFEQAGFGLIDHVFPAAEHEQSGLAVAAKKLVDLMDIAFVAGPIFAGKCGVVVKAFHFLLELVHFIGIQHVFTGATAEDEVDALVRFFMRVNMMDHASEGGYARACADKKDLFFQHIGEDEDAMGSAEGEFCSFCDLLEKVACTCATFYKDDDEFDDIAAIGHGGDAVTAPAAVPLLVNGKIEGDELAWFEIEMFCFGQLDPVPSCMRSCLFDFCDDSFLPGLDHKQEQVKHYSVVRSVSFPTEGGRY